jgi:hypothetical protein
MMTAVLLAVLAWLMVNRDRSDRADTREPDALPTTGVTAGPLHEFLQFAAGTPRGDVPPPGLDHGYTSEGIHRLAAALETFASGRGSAATGQLAHLRAQADRLRRDPRSLDHADIVLDVFTSASEVIAAAVGHDASALRRSAQLIEPDRPLLQQEARVRDLFRQAADLLRQERAGDAQ